MSTSAMTDRGGIWIPFPRDTEPLAVALRNALLERLERAGGHINAVDRFLWQDTPRGLWSAHQAKGRVAEVWLWLNGDFWEPPPAGHKIDRGTLQQRLDEFERAAKPQPLAEAWTEARAAEDAILQVPFRPLHLLTASKTDHAALVAGIDRQQRLIRALRNCVQLVENQLAERFLALRAGDRLRLQDGTVGQVIGVWGVTAAVMVTDHAWPDPERAVSRHYLPDARVEYVECDVRASIGLPAYYWLCSAREKYRATGDLLRATADFSAVFTVADTFLAALNAAAKAWLSLFGSEVERWALVAYITNPALDLPPSAPRSIAVPLARCAAHTARIINRGGTYHLHRSNTWHLEIAVAHQVVEAAFDLLETLVEPVIDLAPGDRLRLPEQGIGRVRSRDGPDIVLDMQDGRTLPWRLLRSFAERVLRGATLTTSPYRWASRQ